VSGLFGGGGQTGAEKKLTGAETQAVQFGLGQAEGTLPQATTALQGPLKFFQALLSGDRSTIMSALSPEISSLTSQYATASKTQQEFAPRGGGRAASLEEKPYAEAGTIEQLIQGAQETGAEGVSSIASMLGQLGLGELGVSSSTAANTVSQLQTSQQNQQQQQAAAGSAIGGLVALLAGL